MSYDLIADDGLVALAVGSLTAYARSPHRRPLVVALATAVGVMTAWLSSEAVKAVLMVPRPCHDSGAAAHCPPPGDWSFPSNHAAIAAALAYAWVRLSGRPRTAPWVLAVAVATARVLAEVHSVLDVIGGASLGACVTWLAVRSTSGRVSQRPGRPSQHSAGGLRKNRRCRGFAPLIGADSSREPTRVFGCPRVPHSRALGPNANYDSSVT